MSGQRMQVYQRGKGLCKARVCKELRAGRGESEMSEPRDGLRRYTRSHKRLGSVLGASRCGTARQVRLRGLEADQETGSLGL